MFPLVHHCCKNEMWTLNSKSVNHDIYSMYSRFSAASLHVRNIIVDIDVSGTFNSFEE